MELTELTIEDIGRDNLVRITAKFRKDQVYLAISFLSFEHLPKSEHEILAKQQIKFLSTNFL